MPLRPDNATLKQLRTFYSVVKSGGFAAAQAELNTSASSISIQMKELEYQLGMTLCDRGRTGFKLTERGKAVFEASKHIFTSFDNFNLELANIREELAGEIRIGLQDNLSTNTGFKMPEALSLFNERQNNVQFRIEEAPSTEQEARTVEGHYNLAIGIFHHRLPSLNYQKLFEEDICLYCAKGHPLFNKPNSKISLKDLQNSKLVSTGVIQNMVNQALDFTREPSAITENMDASSLLILSNKYIGFIPKHFARLWVDSGQMRALLPEKYTSTVDFHMITKRGGRQAYAVETFIQDLLSSQNVDTTQ